MQRLLHGTGKDGGQHLAVDARRAHSAVHAIAAPAQRHGAAEALADWHAVVGGPQLPPVHAVATDEEVGAHAAHRGRRQVAHLQHIPA